MVVDINSATSRLIRHCIMTDFDGQDDRQDIATSLRNSDSSRRKTYCEINPRLSVHEVYNTTLINEIYRISFTRFRTSSHNLSCETGRWNRQGRGRIPMEERLCPCGQVQTETHVVQNCPNTQHIRNMYGFTTLQDLLYGNLAPNIMCRAIHEILESFS